MHLIQTHLPKTPVNICKGYFPPTWHAHLRMSSCSSESLGLDTLIELSPARRAGLMASGERHNDCHGGWRDLSDLFSQRLQSQARPHTTPLPFSQASTNLGKALGLLAASPIGLIKCN